MAVVRWEHKQDFRRDAVILDGVPMSHEHFKECARKIEANGFKALRRQGRNEKGQEIYKTFVERMPND